MADNERALSLRDIDSRLKAVEQAILEDIYVKAVSPKRETGENTSTPKGSIGSSTNPFAKAYIDKLYTDHFHGNSDTACTFYKKTKFIVTGGAVSEGKESDFGTETSGCICSNENPATATDTITLRVTSLNASLLTGDSNNSIPISSATTNANTATKLSKNINLSFTGDVTGSVSLNGNATAGYETTMTNTQVVSGVIVAGNISGRPYQGTGGPGNYEHYAREDHWHPLIVDVTGSSGSADYSYSTNKVNTATEFKLSGAITSATVKVNNTTSTKFQNAGDKVEVTVAQLDPSKISQGTAFISTTGKSESCTTANLSNTADKFEQNFGLQLTGAIKSIPGFTIGNSSPTIKCDSIDITKVTGNSTTMSTSGNAATTTKLKNNATIKVIAGDSNAPITTSSDVSFNGSGNTTLTLNIPVASQTQRGVFRFATDAEVTAGTSTSVAVPSNKLLVSKGSRVPDWAHRELRPNQRNGTVGNIVYTADRYGWISFDWTADALKVDGKKITYRIDGRNYWIVIPVSPGTKYVNTAGDDRDIQLYFIPSK